jgi:Ca2+/H+ antiporter, TMEM165/GDT1 family
VIEPFAVSTGIVALGEMGDKTQLLAMLLAAKFKRPAPILWGILVATLANHAAAAALGGTVAAWLPPNTLRWALGLSFFAMAAWMLIPDRGDDQLANNLARRLGVFGTTVVAFFLAEMGDKTQIATVALAARYDASAATLAAVVAGTTLGMMLANAPVVFMGGAIAQRVPMRVVHGIAAAALAVLGVVTLWW